MAGRMEGRREGWREGRMEGRMEKRQEVTDGERYTEIQEGKGIAKGNDTHIHTYTHTHTHTHTHSYRTHAAADVINKAEIGRGRKGSISWTPITYPKLVLSFPSSPKLFLSLPFTPLPSYSSCFVIYTITFPS